MQVQGRITHEVYAGSEGGKSIWDRLKDPKAQGFNFRISHIGQVLYADGSLKIILLRLRAEEKIYGSFKRERSLKRFLALFSDDKKTRLPKYHTPEPINKRTLMYLDANWRRHGMRFSPALPEWNLGRLSRKVSKVPHGMNQSD